MTAPLDLPMARAAAETLMTSTCTIRRPAGEAITDPDSGTVTRPLGAVVYSGPCRVRPASTWGRNGEAGGEEISPSTFRISVPWTVTGVRRGDFVTVDSSPDPALPGHRFEVRFTPDMGDHITARRLLCEEAG